jgi:hypothetical protein
MGMAKTAHPFDRTLYWKSGLNETWNQERQTEEGHSQQARGPDDIAGQEQPKREQVQGTGGRKSQRLDGEGPQTQAVVMQ